MNRPLPSGNPCTRRLSPFPLVGLLACTIIFFSCIPTKNSSYFKTILKDTLISNAAFSAEELKIQKNDLLMIQISSLNPQEDAVYNAPAVSAGSGASSVGSATGYQVGGDGNIQLHRLGSLHVEGLTRTELKNTIQKGLAPYLKDLVVNIRYLNHNITILGEVNKPQVIPMPEDHLSLLQVLGASGDLTQYGKKDKILVIRETGSGKQFKQINLEDHSIFNSPWYWMQPGDVVYVGPNDIKINQEKSLKRQQAISIGLSALSVAIIILFRIIK